MKKFLRSEVLILQWIWGLILFQFSANRYSWTLRLLQGSSRYRSSSLIVLKLIRFFTLLKISVIDILIIIILLIFLLKVVVSPFVFNFLLDRYTSRSLSVLIVIVLFCNSWLFWWIFYCVLPWSYSIDIAQFICLLQISLILVVFFFWFS